MNGIEVALGLGSNLGDRLDYLRQARNAIRCLPQVTLLASAPLYETDPVDVPVEHADLTFYNSVILIGTELDAHTLYALLANVETQLGRARRAGTRNTARTIDIDLLYYDGQTIRSGRLVVPHPRLHVRRFVLQPLCDLRPKLLLPGQCHNVAHLLAQLSDASSVKRIMTQW